MAAYASLVPVLPVVFFRSMQVSSSTWDVKVVAAAALVTQSLLGSSHFQTSDVAYTNPSHDVVVLDMMYTTISSTPASALWWCLCCLVWPAVHIRLHQQDQCHTEWPRYSLSHGMTNPHRLASYTFATAALACGLVSLLPRSMEQESGSQGQVHVECTIAFHYYHIFVQTCQIKSNLHLVM